MADAETSRSKASGAAGTVMPAQFLRAARAKVNDAKKDYPSGLLTIPLSYVVVGNSRAGLKDFRIALAKGVCRASARVEATFTPPQAGANCQVRLKGQRK